MSLVRVKEIGDGAYKMNTIICTIVSTITCTIKDVKVVSQSFLKLNECGKTEWGLLDWDTELSERMILLFSSAQLLHYYCFLRVAVYRDR